MDCSKTPLVLEQLQPAILYFGPYTGKKDYRQARVTLDILHVFPP
jgi:hypothetical protein